MILRGRNLLKILFSEQKKTLQIIEALAFQIAYIPILFSFSFPSQSFVKILVVSSSIPEKKPSLATLNYLAYMSRIFFWMKSLNKIKTHDSTYIVFGNVLDWVLVLGDSFI